MTAEGASALLITTAERAATMEQSPIYILGAGLDHIGPSYQHPPSWDLRGRDPDSIPNGYVGRRGARRAFAMAGLKPDDVDVCEFYDAFSFEIIRQFEAYEFCGPGEGGDFVMDGRIAAGGRYPVTTDGGTLSFSHPGTVATMQRVNRAVEQLQGGCVSHQVPDAEVAMATNGGAGALFTDVMLLGRNRP
jgi:acetyl-CoA acetyltransferase